MKKITLFLVPLLVFCFLIPQASQAIKPKKFKHYYLGTWENTVDSCGGTGETGSIEIKLDTIKKTGKITAGRVWFNDSRVGDMEAKGKIYFNEKHVRRLRLRYTENDWSESYVITGKITKNKITGKYTHSNYGCDWSGPIELTRNDN